VLRYAKRTTSSNQVCGPRMNTATS
jgi:hypothetical protein